MYFANHQVSGIVSRLVLIAALCVSSVAEARLLDIRNGLILDVGLGVLWLRDANLFFTKSGSGLHPETATNLVNDIIEAVPEVLDGQVAHQITSSDFNTSNGQMSWWGAQAWVGYLNSIHYKGFDNWRLPILRPVNGTAFNYTFSCDGTTDYGKNNTALNSKASELGHVFYKELGNLSDLDTACVPRQTGYGVTNSGPFRNLESGLYWTGTDFELYFENAWHFHTDNGGQGNDYKGVQFYVWPVADLNLHWPPRHCRKCWGSKSHGKH
ncbi:MAG: DUF1566 domain-containing protein [Methylococcaceae bacterium]|nr:DUF1566 domain-containing protein [Methylococcaceae bacterium]